MKKILVGIVALMSVFLIACTAPSDDLARAEVKEEPTVEETITEEVIETSNETTVEMDGTEVPLDMSASTFEFEGFAPGKSHVGTFENWTGSFVIQDGKIISAKGTVDPASVKTDTAAVDRHLKTDDFFDVAKYPEIIIVSKTIGDGNVVADLTFRGVTKEISFPANITSNSIAAEFALDTTPFAFKYVGVDKEVRIKFNMVAQ
jgi:polyisoprenoid-binding protein YceI